jgi:SM-20-related protein
MSASIIQSIHYLDDIISEETHKGICRKLDASAWFFGHASVINEGRPFWKMILDQDPKTDQIWAEAKAHCEAIVGKELIVLRQYANGHTFGQGGLSHTDDHRAGSYTLLYYPMPEWRSEWAGETVFYGETNEIVHSVSPKPNRAILFDARIPHAGLAPSQSFTGLRKTIAFKLIEKQVLDATPLPTFRLERLICNPFDSEAQAASRQALKASLLAALAQSYTKEISPHFLEYETKQIKLTMERNQKISGSVTNAFLDEQEISEIALQRVKSGLAILESAKLLGFETGAPMTEQRTLLALMRCATISDKLVDRDQLLR